MPEKPSLGFQRLKAQRLRTNATEAEKLLWRHLRRLEISGSHFRRQVPIGPYIVDFACMAAQLVIEVDGSQHGDADHQPRDLRRTAWLEAEGYRVLRFWNNDITARPSSVMEAIYAAIYGSPDAEPRVLKHRRRTTAAKSAPPRPAARADPPPAGGG
jgi:very-short-patch-repair endonuclease